MELHQIKCAITRTVDGYRVEIPVVVEFTYSDAFGVEVDDIYDKETRHEIDLNDKEFLEIEQLCQKQAEGIW